MTTSIMHILSMYLSILPLLASDCSCYLLALLTLLVVTNTLSAGEANHTSSTWKGIPMGTTAVYLKWQPNPDHMRNLKGYAIAYQSVGSANSTSGRIEIADPRRSELKVVGLSPNTTFKFEMWHIVDKNLVIQANQPSLLVKTRANSTLPARPNFTWRLERYMGNLSLTFHWKLNLVSEANQGNYFLISWKTRNDSNFDLTEGNETQNTTSIRLMIDKRHTYQIVFLVFDGRFHSGSDMEEISYYRQHSSERKGIRGRDRMKGQNGHSWLCREAYGGEKCDSCAHGFHKFPQCYKCYCNAVGAKGFDCDFDGQCACKEMTSGE